MCADSCRRRLPPLARVARDGPGSQAHPSPSPHTICTSYSGCWSAGMPEIDCLVGRRRGQQLGALRAVTAERAAIDRPPPRGRNLFETCPARFGRFIAAQMSYICALEE